MTLAEAVATLWRIHDAKFDALRAANERGVRGEDLATFVAVSDVWNREMAELCAAAGTKAVMLTTDGRGRVDAIYRSGRYRRLSQDRASGPAPARLSHPDARD